MCCAMKKTTQKEKINHCSIPTSIYILGCISMSTYICICTSPTYTNIGRGNCTTNCPFIKINYLQKPRQFQLYLNPSISDILSKPIQPHTLWSILYNFWPSKSFRSAHFTSIHPFSYKHEGTNMQFRFSVAFKPLCFVMLNLITCIFKFSSDYSQMCCGRKG